MERKIKVLLVSQRLLLAQGICSLLDERPGIAEVEIVGSYFEAVRAAQMRPPDTVVIDMPANAPFFVDRPVQVKGREIKTLVLQEEFGHTRLYTYAPGKEATLQNLLSSILGINASGSAPRLAVENT